MENLEYQRVHAQLMDLFLQQLNVEIPSSETDLFEEGILDSQKFVELLLHIEDSFETQIGNDEFEIENFRCVRSIAQLILNHRATGDSPTAEIEHRRAIPV